LIQLDIFCEAGMASEIEELQKLLKSHRRSIKYLSGLNKDDLRTVLKAVIEPDTWSGFAEHAKITSVQLEQLASAIERAAGGIKT
jgi:hypothetical protein